MGGDKKVSHRYFERGGHGKTVVAEVTLYGRRCAARPAHDRRRPARALVGGHARRRRLGHAVGRVHAGDRDRRDFRRDRPGHGHGRHELDGPRHRASAVEGGPATRRSGSRASRSARSAAERPSPTRAPGSGSWTARARARCTASPRSSPRPRSRSRSPPRPRWPRPARRTSSRRTTSGVACAEGPAAPRPGLLRLRRQPDRLPPPAAGDRGRPTVTRRRSRSTSATRAGQGSPTAGWSRR